MVLFLFIFFLFFHQSFLLPYYFLIKFLLPLKFVLLVVLVMLLKLFFLERLIQFIPVLLLQIKFICFVFFLITASKDQIFVANKLIIFFYFIINLYRFLSSQTVLLKILIFSQILNYHVLIVSHSIAFPKFFFYFFS